LHVDGLVLLAVTSLPLNNTVYNAQLVENIHCQGALRAIRHTRSRSGDRLKYTFAPTCRYAEARNDENADCSLTHGLYSRGIEAGEARLHRCSSDALGAGDVACTGSVGCSSGGRCGIAGTCFKSANCSCSLGQSRYKNPSRSEVGSHTHL
jgi:hypothetical protein